MIPRPTRLGKARYGKFCSIDGHEVLQVKCVIVENKATRIVFSLTWPASMQIYWIKRKRLHKKSFNSQRIGLGHQHGRCFIVLGPPIWPP